MRLLIIICCISGFLAKDIARTSWEIWFKVNQERIIAEKCENKDIPMMHCNGKCYLAKKLKKLEEKEQQHNSKTNPFGQSVKADIISQAVFPLSATSLFTETASSAGFPGHGAESTRDFHRSVFHPPAV